MANIIFEPEEIEDIMFLLEWSTDYVTDRGLKKELQQTITELRIAIKDSLHEECHVKY